MNDDDIMGFAKHMMGDVIIDFVNETQATPFIERVIVDEYGRPIVLVSDQKTVYNWDQIARVRRTL